MYVSALFNVLYIIALNTTVIEYNKKLLLAKIGKCVGFSCL